MIPSVAFQMWISMRPPSQAEMVTLTTAGHTPPTWLMARVLWQRCALRCQDLPRALFHLLVLLPRNVAVCPNHTLTAA